MSKRAPRLLCLLPSAALLLGAVGAESGREGPRKAAPDASQIELRHKFTSPGWLDEPWDIAGLRLGMKEKHFTGDLRRHFQSGIRTRTSTRTGPFKRGVITIPRSELTEAVAYFTLPRTGVGAISRRTFHAPGTMSLEVARVRLHERFGKPAWTGAAHRFLWTSGSDAPEHCAELADAAPGEDWGRTLKARNGEALEDFPLMLSLDRKAPEYRRFAACGTMVVAEIVEGSDGSASSIAVLLFKPEAIARFGRRTKSAPPGP